MKTRRQNSRTRYNQAKREILGTVRTLGEASSREIAIITNRTPENASVMLLHYHRQGLLSRRRLQGKTQAYLLTKKGLERLVWLEAVEAYAGQDEFDEDHAMSEFEVSDTVLDP